MTKVFLICCSIIPLCLQIPYLVSAWSASRLDQWDWIFFITAIPAIIWAAKKEKIYNCDWMALLVVIPMLLLSLSASFHHINALAVASSILLIFTTVWLLASWNFAYKLLPATIILLFGTPSSSYAISLLLMCPVWLAWAIKFLSTIFCFIWIFANKYFNLHIKKGTLVFVVALLGSALGLLHSKELHFEGKSFIPEFTGNIDNFWGRTIEPDNNTKRFFATSTVKQFRYTKNDTDVSVLSIKCGNNIHEIHPASHCLRTSFWTINSERILYLQDNFAVTEIDAQKGSNRYLMWVWFSSEEISTPSFLGFRRHFRSNGNYYTYQISTPIYRDINQSRIELQNFIQGLKTSNIDNREIAK